MRVPFVDLRAQYESIRGEISEVCSDILGTMDLLEGNYLRAFETEFAAFCETTYAVGVGSGSHALYLALRACGVHAGDEIITVASAHFSLLEAIALIGAAPVFVDVDPRYYTMDPAKVEAAVSERTRAIVPVHLYGQTADLNAIVPIARRHGLALVEDARQACGAEIRGRRVGGFGDAAAFSFSLTKNLGAYGDAGAVTTNSRAIAEEVRLLRDHGSDESDRYEQIGLVSHLDDLQAAFLRVKLRHLVEWNDRRRALAQTYDHALKNLNLRVPLVRWGSRHVYYNYVIQVENRDRIRRALGDLGIETAVNYPIPVNQQPAARGIGRVAGDLAVTDALASHALSLPLYPELSSRHLSYVGKSLNATLTTAWPSGIPWVGSAPA